MLFVQEAAASGTAGNSNGNGQGAPENSANIAQHEADLKAMSNEVRSPQFRLLRLLLIAQTQKGVVWFALHWDPAGQGDPGKLVPVKGAACICSSNHNVTSTMCRTVIKNDSYSD